MSEFELIRENLKKIEVYCVENYVPKLAKHKRISVSFELERPVLFGNPEYKHSFTVSADDGIYYRTGGLVQRFGSNEIHDSIYDFPIYAKDLILNWNEVKVKLNSELEHMNNEQNALRNFEV